MSQPSYDEQYWAEAVRALGTRVHEYGTDELAEIEARARAMDDRPPDKLHVIATELESEARPSTEELMVERFGRRRGGA